MSASATSFVDADGAGTMVMGWKISLWEQGAGADCQSNDTHRVAAVSIYTNQAPVSGKKAMLDTSEIVDRDGFAADGDSARSPRRWAPR